MSYEYISQFNIWWWIIQGREVDFVLAQGRELVGAEVKTGSNPGAKDIAGLRSFLDEYPRTARGGVALHGGDESYWLDERLVAAPWWRVV